MTARKNLTPPLTWARLPLALGLALAVCAAPGPAAALDLSEAWRLAQDNDAQLRAARAMVQADRERLPQARARLLPSLTAQVSRYRNALEAEGPDILGRVTTTDSRYNSRGDSLVLRQPLYRKSAWAQWQQAGFFVAASEARLEAETQALLDRLTTAYFEALLAQDQIALLAQQKQAYSAQLGAARSSVSAGSGVRTDIDEAQARLDLAEAEELGARQALDLARRELESLIGVSARELSPVEPARLRERTPAAGSGQMPGPADLTELTERAELASPDARVLRAQIEQARKDVEIARAGHAPTLDAVAQYSRSDSENITRTSNTYRHGQLGLVLNIPLYQGGAVNSQVREALARLQRAESLLEALRRELGVRAHREFRGVSEGPLRLQALEQAVRSALQLVTSNERAFAAGYRTRVDILNAQSQLAMAQRDLAKMRYDYLTSTLRLGALNGSSRDALVADLNAVLRP